MYVCVYSKLGQFEQVSNSIKLLILRTLKKNSFQTLQILNLRTSNFEFKYQTFVIQTLYAIIEIARICLII